MVEDQQSRATQRHIGWLLSALTTALLLAVAAGIGWYRAASRPVVIEELSAAQREELVEDALMRAPGVHERAWFAPEIGYTLRRRARIEAWNDEFRSNDLGYRTRPVAKPAGTYRVLFVGDSWTYGMGIREEESFPLDLPPTRPRLRLSRCGC